MPRNRRERPPHKAPGQIAGVADSRRGRGDVPGRPPSSCAGLAPAFLIDVQQHRLGAFDHHRARHCGVRPAGRRSSPAYYFATQVRYHRDTRRAIAPAAARAAMHPARGPPDA